jgi:hypothetical protein
LYSFSCFRARFRFLAWDEAHIYVLLLEAFNKLGRVEENEVFSEMLGGINDQVIVEDPKSKLI